MNHDPKQTEAVPPFASVHGYATGELDLVPHAVDCALEYTDYSRGVRVSNPDHFRSATYGTKSKAAKIMGAEEWETMPHAAMRLLADEVRRLRAEVARIKSHNDEAERTAIAETARQPGI